ncbi:MAG: chromate transporter [Oscillospiraceae bacterium]|nr:chromate transporter [Oscillospiraceae bacterium]
MIVNFFEYILAMLLAGVGSFGGGIGGINIMKEFARGWIDKFYTVIDANPEIIKSEEIIFRFEQMEIQILNVATISQIGGYAQGMTLAAYLGTYTNLGILGGILGVIAYMTPSVLIIAAILKTGEKLYKNILFKYSVKYINLLSAGLICMLAWNYTVIIFGIDPIIYVAVAGLACFFSIYFNLSPAIIILAGALIGLIWRA